MCLVLKLDNEKVVSIANEQNHRQTESHSHPVPYSYIDNSIYTLPYQYENLARSPPEQLGNLQLCDTFFMLNL